MPMLLSLDFLLSRLRDLFALILCFRDAIAASRG